MKEVRLNRGMVALVDDEDYERVSHGHWSVMHKNGGDYAVRKVPGEKRLMAMARFLVGARSGEIVHHINHNTLDNRRENLRICTVQQNLCSQLKHGTGTSKYKGVHFFKRYGKWQAQVMFNYKHFHLGYFANEEEAARAYDRKARELFGEFALCNFPSEMAP
jgi:hypothetical protein